MGGKRDAREEMEAGNRERGAVARSERERGPEGSISRTARREGEVQIHEAAKGLMCRAQRDAVYGRCDPEARGRDAAYGIAEMRDAERQAKVFGNSEANALDIS
jgi:hypothetical protein